jgi:hypothetical protein
MEMAEVFLSQRGYAIALLAEAREPDDYFEELWRPDGDPANVLPTPVNGEDHPWWLRFLDAYIFLYVFEDVVRLEPTAKAVREWAELLPSENHNKPGVYKGHRV